MASLLAEKLALSRELSTLKPEMNHLRVQCASGEGLLAEKLSLQRELNSVRVELETEKRSLQRVVSKEDGRPALEAQLRYQLEGIQSELSKEKKDRERLESEKTRSRIEFEGHKTLLESKLEALRGRLKTTREQLKESQSALEKNRLLLVNRNEGRSLETNGNTRKRTLQEADEDTAFGTPGDRPAAKKLKRGSTLPGDKSLFSITPFLNRTTSLAPDELHPIKDDGPISDTEDRQEAQVSPISEIPKARATKPAMATAKTNQTGRLRLSKMGQGMGLTKLDRVQEEGAEDYHLGESLVAPQRVIEARREREEQVNERTNSRTQTKDGKKKKQRPLAQGPAKTIFDEEEDGLEQNTGIENLRFTGSKRVVLAPRSGRIDGGLLGAFSPLKKDRKS